MKLIRDCAESVFNELGSGHSEAVYEKAMLVEMGFRDIEGPVLNQVACPIYYRGFTVGIGYIDIVVDNLLVIELKAVAKLTSRDEMQVRKYLLGSGMAQGLLINFSWEDLEVVEIFIDNQKEIIHDQTLSTSN